MHLTLFSINSLEVYPLFLAHSQLESRALGWPGKYCVIGGRLHQKMYVSLGALGALEEVGL